jgi:NAD(P)-dependent dehydrogenase (short-subunit alcohol dehydrogenase family)
LPTRYAQNDSRRPAFRKTVGTATERRNQGNLIRCLVCLAHKANLALTDRLRKRLENDPSVRKMAAAHLVGLAEPVDIAHAALYLASDGSRMITGQILRVDSGITIV